MPNAVSVEITKKSKDINYVIIDEIQEVYSIVNPALTKGEHVKAKSRGTILLGVKIAVFSKN